MPPRYSSFFDNVPDRVRPVLAEAFHQLPRLNDAQLEILADITLDAFAKQSAAPPEDAGARLGISDDDAWGLVTTGSTIVPGIVSETSVDSVVATLEREKLVTSAEVPSVQKLVRLLQQRSAEFQKLLRVQRVTNAVLPSFKSISTTVDVRLHFEDDKIVDTAPVAVAFLATDATHERLWFQLSKAQLETLITDLQGALKQLSAAEEWSTTAPR
jgi:hypothetical protein